MGNSFTAEWGSSIEFGDCLEIMRAWPDQCVQTCVTSPPYWGLRDYGHAGQLGLESTPQEYVAAMVAVFREVRRVLRNDGTLWLNLGDSYSRAPEKGGSGPGNKGNCGNGLDEARRIMSEAKGSSDGAVGRGDRAPVRNGAGNLKPKDLCGIPWMVAFALRADGWYLRQDIIWAKPNPMPESVRDRCTKSHEYIFLLAKSERYYYDADAIKEPATWTRENNPDWQTQRAETNAKKGAGNRNAADGGFTGWSPEDGRNKRSVWTVSTKPYKEAHFATFPPDLIEPCILAGSRPGDVVLDPFMGSGTTAMVAQQHGRKYRGCELQENYRDLQEKRIGAPKVLDLFGNT